MNGDNNAPTSFWNRAEFESQLAEQQNGSSRESKRLPPNTRWVWNRGIFRDAEFQILAEECGGGGDCMFHCIATALHRAASDVGHADLCNQFKPGMEGMRYIRTALSRTITPQNAKGIAEDLKDGVDSDRANVAWINDLNVHLKKVEEKTIGSAELCTFLQKMIQTPGTYYQGTDIILRHYVRYVQEFIANGKSDSKRTGAPENHQNSPEAANPLLLWTQNSLPALGFVVLIDAVPGVMEIIGGLHMDFYMVLVNYNSVHWRLGYVRSAEDVQLDEDSSFHCIVDNKLVCEMVEEFEALRRRK